ncbi:MAG: hypothetical protein ACI4PF_03780 [Christensenellales bacterium]
MDKEIQKLMKLFPNSFINQNKELILVPKTNLYFRLEDVRTKEDLYFKVIAWCSRSACKQMPYYQDWRNKKYQEMVRNNLNTFLGTNFSKDEWMDIYTKFGNGCNEEKCREFIKNNFNFDLVKELL